jgi:N-acyl-phosphatidylethanolamine-hydrolysing phospholipase D
MDSDATRHRPAHHREDGGFRNPWPAETERSFRDFLRWRRERRGLPPQVVPPPEQLAPATPNVALPRASAAEVRITWVGHATFLLQMGRWNVLTDPVWSERASPISWTGPSRLVPPGLSFEALPPIDLVILSHDHYDHLDDPTVRRLLARHGAGLRWVVPLGLGKWLARRGAKQVIELDWWGSARVEEAADGLDVTAYPAQHWSRRRPFERSPRLWASFGLDAGAGRRVYFGGDSGYAPIFREIGSRAGPFDAALLPIGAYEPRWFMRGAHMDPSEAVRTYLDLGGRGRFVAMHWGTFILTDEPILEPPARTRQAWLEAGLPDADLSILRHGETLIL